MSQTQRISKNNTTVIRDGNSTVVTLHSTKIVTTMYDPRRGNCIVLDTGGWNTVTTRTRMNQVSNEMDLGFCVSQLKGQLCVIFQGQTVAFNRSVILEVNTGKIKVVE